MPHHTRWSDDETFVIYTLEGAITGDDLLAAIDEGLALVEGQTGELNFCWDARKITALIMSPADVNKIVQRMRTFAARDSTGRTAIVTHRTTDTIMAELLVVKGYTEARTRKRFSSMADAADWLRNSAPE